MSQVETPGETAARALERKISLDLVRNEPMVQLLLSRVRQGAFSAEDGLVVVLEVVLRELHRLRSIEVNRALMKPLEPMVIGNMVFTPPGWTREPLPEKTYADAHKPRLGGTGCADDCAAHPPHVPEPLFAKASIRQGNIDCRLVGCRPGCPHVAPNGDRGIQKT